MELFRGFALLSVLALASLQAAADLSAGRLPALSFPRAVEITEISPDLIKNGMPMRIYGFRSHRRMADVMKEMDRHLSERGFLVGDVLALGEMKTLGVSDDAHFINIQGQRSEYGSGSSGFIVITPRPDLYEPEKTTPTVPLPDDVDVLSHEFFRDGPRMGEAVLGMSPRAALDVGQELVSGFEQDGWTPAPQEMNVTSNELAVYRVLKKGDRLCRLITMDQLIDGSAVTTVNVNCHN